MIINRITIDDGDCAVLASRLHRRSRPEETPMDGSDFDSLVRTLGTAGSRRAFVGLLSGTLGLFGAPTEPAAARNCRRIENRKRRRRCLRKACGDDGCGGVCGDCTAPRTCQDNRCACPAPEVECNGACVPPCEAWEARDPRDCSCCTTHFGQCSMPNSKPCCSGNCFDAEAGDDRCVGLNAGTECEFGGQCESGECEFFSDDGRTCS